MVRTLLWLAAAAAAVESPEPPAWLQEKRDIIPQKSFIHVIGRSDPRRSEAEAKDEALSRAVQSFVKYAKFDVDSFSRSVEVYSAQGGKNYESADLETQSLMRARAFVRGAMAEDWHIERKKKDWLAAVLLRVPREEFERIGKEGNIKLSVDILFYHEDKDGNMRVLPEGSVLKSGDGYAVYLKPSDTCHIYIYQVDDLGKSFRLFPNPDDGTAANPVLAGQDTWIPNASQVAYLDATTGKEHFVVFASPEAIAELEGEAGAGLTRVQLDRVAEIGRLGKAGVRDKRNPASTPPPKRQRDIVAVKKKLQAKGAFVWDTWFWHK